MLQASDITEYADLTETNTELDMRRLVLVGRSECGKTTLKQVLRGEKITYEKTQYVSQYEGKEKEILQVRPGITDFSSIEFINLDEIVGTEDPDAMYEKYVLKRKNELRVKYAESVSFLTDVTILARTLAAVWGKAFGFLVKKEHR